MSKYFLGEQESRGKRFLGPLFKREEDLIRAVNGNPKDPCGRAGGGPTWWGELKL